MNLMSKSCLMGTICVPLIHKQLCVRWAGIQYNSILKDKDSSETVIKLQMESKVLSVLKSTKLLHEHTIYMCMHAYCVPRGVNMPDIVKEMLMFALWLLESKMFWKWIQIYTLDVTQFKFNILFVDRLNVQVFCNNSLFLICTFLSWKWHIIKFQKNNFWNINIFKKYFTIQFTHYKLNNYLFFHSWTWLSLLWCHNTLPVFNSICRALHLHIHYDRSTNALKYACLHVQNSLIFQK